ncbi:MAG TPA: DUF885 domain-containing protein [Candidatus Limnocylindria bacterium]|nr:DUF885 domain-containing protein [Candidatus Limnocylindria bacterium]
MKARLLSLATVILFAGCATSTPTDTSHSGFQATSESFIAEYFKNRPPAGVALGWHQYDGQIVVPTAAFLAAEAQRLRTARDVFDRMDPAHLDPKEAWDRSLIRLQIDIDLLSLDTIRSPWRNPMDYAGAVDIQIYLKRDFAPLAERLLSASRALTKTPAVFAAARQNLEPVLPKPFVETAIEISEGSASFLEHDGLTEARRCPDAQAIATFESAAKVAIKEFRDFAVWLKQNRLPTANNSFALGRKAYQALLRTERIDATPEAILKIGLAELKDEQRRFAEAAKLIDPNKPPIEVFKAIQKDHPTETSLIPDARKHLASIRQYVGDHHLLTIPGTNQARVEETPPPQRSTTFASMVTPGPFETRATEAYYYITPVEPEWPPAQKDEWLTAFNYYTTDVVTIHEAYPGHFVQFLALNASSASTPAKVFSSYAFGEGWAHYCEQMMLDEGFPAREPGESAPDHALRTAKYRLAQSDEALLRICRLCCALKLHCEGMSVDEATRFFQENCYYEAKPARQEAIRGTFDPGYGFYTLGKLQILKLRKDLQAQEGAAFTLQSFHDRLLSHGAPPLRMLRELFLKDPKLADAIL